MFSADWRADQAVQEMRFTRAQERWEGQAVLTQAGLESHGKQTRRGCQMLCQLGHRLVAWGRSLERTGLANSGTISFIL